MRNENEISKVLIDLSNNIKNNLNLDSLDSACNVILRMWESEKDGDPLVQMEFDELDDGTFIVHYER